MSKKHNEVPVGALVRLRSDNSIGVVTGMLTGSGKYGIYTIKWIVDYSDNQNFQQSMFFEVIG